MTKRYRQYLRNIGTGRAIANTLFLAFFMYIVVRASIVAGNTNATVFVLALASIPIVVGLFAPLLALGALVRNGQRTSQFIKFFQFLVFAMLVILVFGRPPMPWWGWLVMLGMISFLHGLNFWFFSDPRVLTERGMKARAYPPASTRADAETPWA